MQPPKRPSVFALVATVSLAGLLLAGCGRSGDDDEVLADRGHDAKPPARASERSTRKTLSAYNAVSEYLRAEDPALRDKLQKAAERFVRDKDGWRARLKQRERDLQPKIARLRDQIAKTDAKSADALRSLKGELAGLENQRVDAEHKLSQLEAVTYDTWKALRDQLGVDDTPPPAEGTPKRSTQLPQ